MSKFRNFLDKIREIWNKIVAFLTKIPLDKWLHFIAGDLTAAFAFCVFGCRWAVAPAIFVGITKEAFDYATTKKIEWLDLLATAIGGLIIQIFIWI